MNNQYWDSRMDYIDTSAIREQLKKGLYTGEGYVSDRNIAIFGAGDSAERYFVNGAGKEDNILYFIDDTPMKQGTRFLDRPIITTEQAQELCKGFLILICSDSPKNIRAMYDVICKRNIEGADIDLYFKYHVCRHSAEILAVYDMLQDPFSKATYSNVILYRMGESLRDQAYTRSTGSMYFEFAPFSEIRVDEIFVDCGACVGDTFEGFLPVILGSFRDYYAFEPDSKYFKALNARVKRLEQEWGISEEKIHLVFAGVGDKSGQLSDDANELGRGFPVCSIDEYFARQPITFLKADIEGYEERMLDGAKLVLQRDKPKLAVCIYHGPGDMYRIPLKIQQYCPEYKFVVRQYGSSWADTVLYAYV